MTDRQIVDKINDFKFLIKELEISSIKDIPTLDELTKKFKSGNATLKDAWFSKLYSQGLKIQQGAIDAPELGNLKQLALDMQKRFPSQRDTKAGAGAVGEQIRKMRNVFQKQGVNNTLGQPFSINMFKTGFEGQRLNIKALNESVKNVELGLGLKKQVKSNILNSVPTDEMMRKVLAGIKDIPDQETKRLVLLGLFGTRGTQINNLVSDRIIAADVERPYYDRKSGIMRGDIDITEGRKGLADKVPFGPFMKDVMDYQYDKATNNSKDLNKSVFSKKINLTNVINKYLFKNKGINVLTTAEMSELGRPVGGYTDLRRMALSWAAKSLGDTGLASELLTHGSEADMDKSVTGRFYIPGEGTDVNKLRAFTTGIEQNIARILGHNNYKSLIKDLNVETYTTESDKVKTFKKTATIIAPETKIVRGPVTQPDLLPQGVDSDLLRLEKESNIKRQIVIDSKANEVDIKDLMKNENLSRVEAEAKLGIGDSKVKPLTEYETNLKDKLLNYSNKIKETKLEKVAKVAKKTPTILGVGISGALTAKYVATPKESFADEAWNGFLAGKGVVKAATVATEAAGMLLPVDASMVGLGTEQEMVAQRQATEEQKQELATDRETYPVAPGAPEAGRIPAEIDREARSVKEMDMEKEKEFIDRARFIKQGEQMEGLGF